MKRNKDSRKNSRKIYDYIIDLGAYGRSDLNHKQRKDLKKIKNGIDNDVKTTASIIDINKFKKNKKKKCNYNYNYNVPDNILMESLMVFILPLLSLPILLFLSLDNVGLSSIETSEYTGTVISVTMTENNKLSYDIKSISLLGDTRYLNLNSCYWLKTDINSDSDSYNIDGVTYDISKDLHLRSMNITKNYSYIQYCNNELTASKEMIFATKKPDSISTKNFTKVNNRLYENVNPLQINSYLTTYDKDCIILSEKVGGGNLSNNSLKYTFETLEKSMTTSELNEKPEIIIRFDELGDLKLSEINEVAEAPCVIYTADDNILRIKNEADGIEYVYISSIGNLGCNASDLLETNIDNLYIHKDFNNTESFGYKTFAIKTDNNLYIFKLNGLLYESLQESIFKQFNIECEQIEIKTLQNVSEVSIDD